MRPVPSPLRRSSTWRRKAFVRGEASARGERRGRSERGARMVKKNKIDRSTDRSIDLARGSTNRTIGGARGRACGSRAHHGERGERLRGEGDDRGGEDRLGGRLRLRDGRLGDDCGERERGGGREGEGRARQRGAPCRFEDRSSIDRSRGETHQPCAPGPCGPGALRNERGGRERASARESAAEETRARDRDSCHRDHRIDQSRWLRSFATATTSTTRAKIARFEMPGAGTHWRRAPWTWRGTCKPFLRCEVCECSFERVRDYADRRARRPRFGCGLAASGQ